MPLLNAVLSGAVAMASFIATLFFLRFWRQTKDSFFLLFAAGFAVDAISRFVLGFAHPTDTAEPFFYVPRLVTSGLIIAAIFEKNRSKRST
jgi:uncharacterized membrane protein HdeD (DUF308 family)